MLPGVRQETGQMEAGVMTRAIMAVQRNELTPEAALLAWQEIAMIRRLLKNFETRVVVGASVADELGPALDPQGASNG